MSHGSYSTYVNHHCRCALCTKANTVYKAKWATKNTVKVKQQKTKYYSKNREFVIQKSAGWKKENPEKRRLSAKIGSARRRARLLKAKTFPSVDTHITNCYGKPCFFCGASSDTHEHLIPISRGGDHSEGNIVPACLSCNQTKSGRLLIEWRKFNMIKYDNGESISAISFKPIVR